jgi:hypothetical protein
MRVPMIVIGVIMLALGALMATGMFRYTDRDKVVDMGPLEIEATKEKATPPNWGYLLLAGGAIALVVGAVAGRKA